MLTTTGFRDFGIELDSTVNDGTVTILSGTALLSNSLVLWYGMQAQLNSISNFTGFPGWQNVLLYLHLDSTFLGPVMNYSHTAIAPTKAALDNPAMSDSAGQPISLFTFRSIGGSDTTLVSYTQFT